jgi:hypothetical protein
MNKTYANYSRITAKLGLSLKPWDKKGNMDGHEDMDSQRFEARPPYSDTGTGKINRIADISHNHGGDACRA